MANQSLAIKKLLFKLGVHPYSDYFSKGRDLAILRYHSLADSHENDYVSPNIALSVDSFDAQIDYLSRKYTIVSMDDVAECIYHRRSFPKRAVAITFDDGYRDNYSAYQVLREHGVSGTFYVVAGCVGGGEPLWLFEIIYLIKNTALKRIELDMAGRSIFLSIESDVEKSTAIRTLTALIKSNNRPTRELLRRQLREQLSDVIGLEQRAAEIMLTWEQLKEMSENGMIIGAHTMTHLNLPNADPEDARREIRECRRNLEERLNRPVTHFSYPNGGQYAYYNQEIIAMVKDAGYVTSTTSNNGLASIDQNPLEMRRIRVTPNLAEISYQMEWEPIVEKLMKKS